MTIEELKTAVKNLSVYLDECHGERDTVTFTVNVVRSIKANYEELIKYKENYEDLINRQQEEKETMQQYIDCLRAEIERLQKIIVGFMDEVGTWSNKYDVDISNIHKLPILAKEDYNIKNKIKSEAIKEFARRARGMITIRGRQKDYFDNLVKEMVGADE